MFGLFLVFELLFTLGGIEVSVFLFLFWVAVCSYLSFLVFVGFVSFFVFWVFTGGRAFFLCRPKVVGLVCVWCVVCSPNIYIFVSIFFCRMLISVLVCGFSWGLVVLIVYFFCCFCASWFRGFVLGLLLVIVCVWFGLWWCGVWLFVGVCCFFCVCWWYWVVFLGGILYFYGCACGCCFCCRCCRSLFWLSVFSVLLSLDFFLCFFCGFFLCGLVWLFGCPVLLLFFGLVFAWFG